MVDKINARTRLLDHIAAQQVAVLLRMHYTRVRSM